MNFKTELENSLVLLYNTTTTQNNSAVHFQTICQLNPNYMHPLILETRIDENNPTKTFHLIQQWLDEYKITEPFHFFITLVRQYNYWDDLKQCGFYLQQQQKHHKNPQKYEPFILLISYFINEYLQQIINNQQMNPQQNQLFLKSIPREKSKFNVLYDILAMDWYERTALIKQPAVPIHTIRANYRKVISRLTQPPQQPQQPPQQQPPTEQEILDKMWKMSNQEQSISADELQQVELQWETAMQQWETIHNVLPIVDLEMQPDIQWRKIIGMVCRILSKSTFHKRLFIIYRGNCTWINGENKTMLECIIEMKNIVNQHPQNQTQTFLLQSPDQTNNQIEQTQNQQPQLINKNIYAGIRWMIEGFLATQTTNETIEQLTCILISDMKYMVEPSNIKLHTVIEQMFYGAGVYETIHQQPFICPHFVYCTIQNNDDTQTITPTYSNNKRSTMFSAREAGLTCNQWRELTQITQSYFHRQRTPFETIHMILQNYIAT